MTTKTNLVYVDPELEEIMPDYLENRRKEIPVLRQALKEQTFQPIEFIGHKMRGTGPGYGLQELGTLGGILETAAQKKDPKTIETAVTALQNYLDCLEIKYNKD